MDELEEFLKGIKEGMDSAVREENSNRFKMTKACLMSQVCGTILRDNPKADSTAIDLAISISEQAADRILKRCGLE